MYSTIISVEQLQNLQQPFMVFDCTFDLTQPDAGEQAYRAAHIPGAVYAHLDTALSAKTGPAMSGGRHPLPTQEAFAAWLGSVGFANGMQAVVYDRNGVNYAGRLWWMLKWVGHDAVAVLDGGLQAWQAAGGAVSAGVEPSKFSSNFVPAQALSTLVATETVVNQLGRASQTIVDARATPRFKGEVEPLDPVAGHIPGALNRFFKHNLDVDGHFKPAAQLRDDFTSLLGPRAPEELVHQCGSGVTACHNLLAMEHAGLTGSVLYPGSWSEWSADPARPVAQGG
ncbi:sulfurtransferase [Rhodoferax sp.]|uniref:sulfurtransferase n=1 Tax=Rhodoferax sp. TaxID=50421 RepID=UPI0025FE9C7F|nr:sulfurtransferase [Rhodoferax sp.]